MQFSIRILGCPRKGAVLSEQYLSLIDELLKDATAGLSFMLFPIRIFWYPWEGGFARAVSNFVELVAYIINYIYCYHTCMYDLSIMRFDIRTRRYP